MYLDAESLASSVSYWQLIILVFLAYLLLVHFQRYQRARSLERRYAPAGRASFANLSNDQAQAILRTLTELEFPKIFGFSIIFALFKVGGAGITLLHGD